MTLKEQLDAKIKRDTVEGLWSEINNLFLKSNYKSLQNGLTMVLFTSSTGSPIYYYFDKIDTPGVGKSFSTDYYRDCFAGISELCEYNGMEYVQTNEFEARITYNPA